MKYAIICLSLVIVSCNLARKQDTGDADNKSNFSATAKDTLITYEIGGISLEGAGAEVNYVNGKITKSTTLVCGETGQATIVYEFGTDKIEVRETKYVYKTTLENVKSEADMQLEHDISYFIDFNGNIMGKEIPERIDIFKEFKEVVPFELK